MKEYTYRRISFYALHGQDDFEDEHKNFKMVVDESTVIADAVTYLKDGTSYLRFPGAARAVAIAVADIIARNFNENFFDILNDKNLMNMNDPFFATYDEAKEVYDAILESVPLHKINWSSERMGITERLILQEYMLDEKGLEHLPRN